MYAPIPRKDKLRLRDLAKKVAEIAESPREAEKAQAWQRHNDLEAGNRPMVLCGCDRGRGFDEIVKDAELQCKSKTSRDFERKLLERLFFGEKMGDDTVIDKELIIPTVYRIKNEAFGLMIEAEQKKFASKSGSFHWEPTLPDYAKLDTLKYQEFKVYRGLSRIVKSMAEDVFGGILDVKTQFRSYWTTPSLSAKAIYMRGMEQFYLDMYDYPDEVHKMFRFLTDNCLRRIEFMEKEGLLSLNNGNQYVGSGGYGFTKQLPSEGYKGAVGATRGRPPLIKTQDLWGFVESQETVTVSPAMYEEFVFPYLKEIATRFGLNCYGCCEPLERTIELIKTIPNLRRVSVSPWANVPKMAEALQDKYVFSLKPNPATLAVPNMDKAEARKWLKENIAICKAHNCKLEIIMKDLTTVGNNPNNVIEWTKMAREELANY